MPDAKILIVEDEAIEAMDIQQRLAGMGYPLPDIAHNGEEGVRKVEEAQPDLILMDIMMPGKIDGITAAEQIRARFDIPIIFLTAYADENTLRRAKITTPYGYMVKPFQERELHISVDMALYRHKMERKLRETEKWLATTLRSIGDGVIATDEKGLITFMNPVAEDLTGWKLEEVRQRKLTEVFNIVNRDSRKPAENPVVRVMLEGNVVGLANHTVLISRAGKEIPINDTAAPIKDEKGKLLGVVLVFSDITEREKAQEVLRESEERQRLAIAATNLGTWDYNPVTGVLKWDSRCKELFGLPPEEPVDYDIFLAGLHQEDRERTHRAVQATLESAAGGNYNIEYRTVGLKDGGMQRWIRATGRAFFNESGQAVRFIGTVQDITERKQAEQALKDHARQLEQSNKDLQDFAFIASHDLQEPLRKVIAFGEFLKTNCSGTLDEKNSDYLSRMIGGAERMRYLIEELLQLSRVTTRALPFAPTDLGKVARDVLEDLDIRLRATGGEVRLGDLPVIEADGVQMRQLLQNLLSNALKFHKEEVPPIIQVDTVLTGDGFCEIAVSDNGIGFDLKYRERIFRPFQRLHGRGVYEGSGMGLTICKKIVERHGGEITVESEPGRGTAFKIRLPVHQK